MELIAKLQKLKGNIAQFKFLETLNVEHLKTLFGTSDNIEVLVIFRDKRHLTDKQRRLYRALLNDIYNWTGHTTDYLHEGFKEYYWFLNAERISTSKASSNSISDMNKLLELVIDFMFQHNVPFKRGYELLPKNEQWYLYNCCKHRKCACCGKPNADIHHAINLVGMGGDRKQHNHLDSQFISLCRQHHNEVHNLGLTEFMKRHKVQPIKLDEETLKKINVM